MNDNNLIADARKGGDLLKSFEQSNLVNSMRSFTYKLYKGQSPTSSSADCVYELFFLLIYICHIKQILQKENEKYI